MFFRLDVLKIFDVMPLPYRSVKQIGPKQSWFKMFANLSAEDTSNRSR